MLRGASWLDGQVIARAVFRNGARLGIRAPSIGFRVVVSSPIGKRRSPER